MPAKATTAWPRFADQTAVRLLDGLRDAVFIIDGDTLHVLDVNQAAEELSGYSRDELLTMTAAALHDPEDGTALDEAIGEALARGGIARPYHVTWRRKDGGRLALEFVNQRADTARGPTIVAAGRDITDRLRQAASLRESAAHLQEIVDNAPAVIYTKDRWGRLTLVNRGFEALVGLDRAAALGKSSHDLFPAAIADDHADHDTLVLLTGRPITVQEHAPAHDGLHTFLSVKFPLYDADGRTAGLCGISSDVTELTRAEEQRDHFFAMTTDLLMVVADGRITRVNPAFERALGYTADELVGMDPQDLIHEDDRAASAAANGPVEAATPGFHVEVRYRHRAGGYHWLDWTVAPPGPGGVYYCAARDVTEARAVRDAAAARARHQEALAAFNRSAVIETNIDVLFEQATRVAVTALDMDCCGVVELEPGGETLRLRCGTGWPEGAVGTVTVPTAHGSLAVYTLRVDAPVIASDLATETRFTRGRVHEALGFLSAVSVPVRTPRGPFGVLSAFSRARRDVTADDAQFLDALAGTLASAVERVQAERALGESEERYRRLFEDATEGIFQTDGRGRFRIANMAVAQIMAYDTPEELMQAVDNIRDIFVDPSQRDAAMDLLTAAGGVQGYECQVRRRDGSIAMLSMNVRLLPDPAGGPPSVAGVVTDVTEERAALAALQRSEELYRSIVESTSEGVWTADAAGMTTFVSRRMAEMLGCGVAQMVGRPLTDFMDDGPHADAPVVPSGADGRCELRLRHRNGSDVWTDVRSTPLYDADGRHTGSLALVADTTEIRQARQYKHRALHDVLTGLANRALFDEHLDYGLRAATRRGEPFAVLLIDLDGFKRVNDTHGHHAGDLVLQEIAQRLRDGLRDSDTVARLGGDEFAVLLTATDAQQAGLVAEKLHAAASQPVRVAGSGLSVGLSIGIAAYPAHTTSSAMLLQRADEAMYAVKRAGGGCRIWSADLLSH